MSRPEPATGKGSNHPAGHPLPYLFRQRRAVLAGILCLLATSGLAQAIPWIVKRAIEALERGQGHIGRYAWLIGGLALAQAAIRILSRILLFNAARDAEYTLRKEAFARLTQLGDDFYQQVRTGDLLSRLTNDLSSVRALMGAGVLHVGNTVFAYAIALPLMIRIDPWLTLLGLCPYPLLLLGARAFARGVYSRSRELQQALAQMSATIEENLTGIRELKAHGLEARRAALLEGQSAEYLQQAVRLARWRAGLLPVVGIGSGLSLVIVMWAGGRQVIAQQLSLGSLVAFTLYLGLLAWPTISIGWILSLWQRGLSAWQRLQEILQARSPLEVSLGALQASGLPHGAAAAPSNINARGLSVRRGAHLVLQQLDFVIPAGALVAIVGRVGSGKSTLAEALARLVEVRPGTLFFGEQDVTEQPVEQTRRQVSYAPQTAFLFSRSIRDNIAYGLKPDHGLPEPEVAARVQAAAEAAGLQPDLDGLPAGLDTVVGERGYSLSGGQRQRVALARALIADSPTLIMDDSLCAVDADTERAILSGLRRHLAGRTAILISHRLSALQLTDTVLVLDEGQLVEVGPHEELLARGGLYAELYQRQLLLEELSG